MRTTGYIGVDLDGTLAYYDGHDRPDQIGPPIPAMLARVKEWLAQGIEVRIITARANPHGQDAHDLYLFHEAIEAWCLEHVGKALYVGCEKSYHMLALYDDRAKQVVVNEGVLIEEQLAAALEELASLRLELSHMRESDAIQDRVALLENCRALEEKLQKLEAACWCRKPQMGTQRPAPRKSSMKDRVSESINRKHLQGDDE